MLPSIQPAKLARSLAAFNDPDWLFELKHDGFRSLAYIESGQCRLVSRHRNTYKSFETLRIALARLRVKKVILDGEIACLDSEGRSQFKELLYRRGRELQVVGCKRTGAQQARRSFRAGELPKIEGARAMEKRIDDWAFEEVVF